MENQGYFTVANGDLIKATVSRLRKRRAKTSFTWVKGHAGNEGNTAADVLANEGSAKANATDINIKPATALLLPGAKLQAMTQSLTYKIIRKVKMNAPTYRKMLDRKATKKNMGYATAAAADNEGGAPTIEKIWKSTGHKDISRSARFFSWIDTRLRV
jgi:ribonuclease HI